MSNYTIQISNYTIQMKNQGVFVKHYIMHPGVTNRAGYCGPKNVLRYIAISKKLLQYIAIFINLI